MKKLLLLALTTCLFSLAASPFDLQKLRAETEESRGLKFRSSVDVRSVSREEMGKVIARELDRELPGKELAAREKALKAFGLISPGTDLRKAMERLLGDQVAGIYDPREKKLYVLSEAKAPGDDPFFDLSQAFDVREIFIIHEMAHALADQHFDLAKSLKLDRKGNDDELAAALAVAEGDATITMFDVFSKRFGLESGELAGLGGGAFDTESLLSELLGEDVPKYLARTLLFSYLSGMDFVSQVSGGNRAVIGKIYRDPPLSTEQILHPDKYIRRNDPPVKVEMKVPAERLKRGVSVVSEGTWGELVTAIILEEWGADGAQAAAASAGWGGDRYAVLESGKGELSFFWRTAWDTEKDAAEFESAAKKNQGLVVSRRGVEVTIECRMGKPAARNAANGGNDAKDSAENRLPRIPVR